MHACRKINVCVIPQSGFSIKEPNWSREEKKVALKTVESCTGSLPTRCPKLPIINYLILVFTWNKSLIKASHTSQLLKSSINFKSLKNINSSYARRWYITKNIFSVSLLNGFASFIVVEFWKIVLASCRSVTLTRPPQRAADFSLETRVDNKSQKWTNFFLNQEFASPIKYSRE